MVGFLSGKVKRKDVDDVSDEFSEFSLSSPARKIRRLAGCDVELYIYGLRTDVANITAFYRVLIEDADLPPIMEEDEVVVPQVHRQQWPGEQQMRNTAPEIDSVVEDAAIIPPNEERAIVLYKPVDSPLLLYPSSSNSCFTVCSDLFPGLKNKVFFRRNSNLQTVKELEDDKSLAVVPWLSKGRIVEETMDTEDTEDAEGSSMEVEETAEQTTASAVFGLGGEVFQQCHQHCMAPPIPTSTSTPIT